MQPKTKEEDALKSQIANLEQELRTKNARLKEMQVARSGVKIGERVVSKGKPYIVTDIRPAYGKAWVKGQGFKKDGTLGLVQKQLFDDWSHA